MLRDPEFTKLTEIPESTWLFPIWLLGEMYVFSAIPICTTSVKFLKDEGEKKAGMGKKQKREIQWSKGTYCKCKKERESEESL